MILRLFLIVLSCALCGTTSRAETVAAPELSVELGAANVSEGLQVPSGGDGVNVAVTVGGASARRMTGEGAQYLYVAVNHQAYRGPRDLYVSAEVLDDTHSRVSIEYDKAGPISNLATQYATGEGSIWLTGEKREAPLWRKGVFFLPAARLQGGQNFNADFRLVAKNVAFRSLTVSTRPPPGYDFIRPVSLPSLDNLRVARPTGIEWILGNDASAEDAAVYKALSATSVESYVDWAGVEPRRDEWDWSRWDRQAAILKAAGLKWVPFLIAGPAHATPLWFQDSDASQPFQCLEHGQSSKVQSIFNPALRPAVTRFLRAFAARYRDTGVLESVLLGVSGVYGESLYPAGSEGDWTTRLTGNYHNHTGWWAGDEYAARAFREAMKEKYSSLAALNAAWSTRHISWDAVTTFLPDRASSDRARADFVEWYQAAMTEYARFWVQTMREALPQTPIYLATGGSGTPILGTDFTAQAKAIAPFNAGLRITNEGNDYATNFALTREAVTATRLYKTTIGLEPAGNIYADGMAARIYNATTSGARQMHDYAANFSTDAKALRSLRENLPYLMPQRPRLQAALYVSRESWVFDDGAPERLHALAAQLRDLTDWDFVTRDSVADGALGGARVLLLCESPVLEPSAATSIEAWVRQGGILIAFGQQHQTPGNRLHDNSAWRTRMFTTVSAESSAGIRPVLGEASLAAHVRHLGRGYTVYLPDLGLQTLPQILQPLLSGTSRYLANVSPLAVDSRLDENYSTITESGVLRFHKPTATIHR